MMGKNCKKFRFPEQRVEILEDIVNILLNKSSFLKYVRDQYVISLLNHLL